ncbi:MAG TPA: S8 family serine peptidase [Thermoanaerobaculia bacterium]|nr:S8 family serine peptidase [Thermoanaerobaculia bacterium]
MIVLLHPYRPRRPLPAVLALLVLALGGAAAVFAQSALPERAKAQIAAFTADKQTWTPAQRKMDSQLIYAARMVRGEAVVPGIASLPSVFNRVRFDRQDPRRIVTLDVKAAVGPALLAALEQLGGVVLSSHPEYGAVRVQLPLLAVETAAGLPGVRFIGPAERPRVNPIRRPFPAPGAVRIRGAITNAIVSSQGDHAHAADLVRAMGITGTGVKVGVLSSGVDSLASEQTAGALPAVTVLAGQAGMGDEGTAMLEIVHTLAPGAQLYFATGDGSEAAMASNILALHTAGCSVIIDDVTYFDEGVFEDGPIATAVETVTAAGALYFSSAANSGNEDSGTSGTWEGDFVNSGVTVAGFLGSFHNFGGGQTADEITGSIGFLSLKWSDPLGASNNDYDLYVVDSLGDVLASSTNAQTGSQDPYEAIDAAGGVGDFVVITLASGSARALHLDTERGELAINTAFNTSGHNAAAGALTVAAVDVGTAGGNAFVGGAGEPVEVYSSDGPRRVFFQSNGAAITPGNFLIGTNGGTLLAKPDLTAADCVSTNVGGDFNPFCGTSAAAPHAGAIAALAFSMASHPTAAQIKAAMLSSALDIMAAGADRDSGSGIVMANRTIAALSTTGPPPLKFFTLAPCRLIDTRNAAGPLGGPALQGSAVRSFALTGTCGIPTTAKAVSLNVTVTQPASAGDLRLYATDVMSIPLVSNINYPTGRTLANNAVVGLPALGAGTIDVQNDGAGTVQLILDVNGYFH